MKQAMIFAAGLGTRLKPLTDTMPKALVRVGGQPLLWHVLTKLHDSGFERVVINVHHFAQQIVDYVELHRHAFGVDIRISDETKALLDTGGGISHALPLFDADSPVLIHNVDILSNVDLALLYDEACRLQADALLLVSRRATKRYLLFDDELLLEGWTNTETGEVRSPYPGMTAAEARQLAFSGIHVLAPRVFPLLGTMGQCFGIIDFYLRYCHQCAFMAKVATDLRLMDVGKMATLGDAEQFLDSLAAMRSST